MPVSAETFRRVANEDPESKWELACGQLRRKPPMAMNHNRVAFELAYELRSQLDRTLYEVRADAGYVQVGDRESYIPDVMIVPTAYSGRLEGTPVLEQYAEPLPLIVEVWSPSTGAADRTSKLAAYQERGDHEIWLVQPRDHSITAFRRQPDGSYAESVYRDEVISLSAIHGIAIDLRTLRW